MILLYQTLYRKWRPKTFDDVCGQEHITSILRYEVTENKTSHAYLFCGSRGTGKTTCAKLLARAINCEHPQNGSPCGVCDACRGIESGRITDVIEMDAASNNGVDNIRDIRDDVVYAPTECKKRVFIIDEVHMLSVSAFNALLKTLEEPPEHIVFILATTEMHKIPATILSRCQRFDFRRIETKVIADRLRIIADAENIAIDGDALYLIARIANGGMRDAIGMLELCAGSGGQGKTISSKEAAALIGTSPVEETASVVEAIQKCEIGRLLAAVDALYRESRDIGVFWQSLVSFYRDMLVVRTIPDPLPFLDLPESQTSLPVTLAKGFPTGVLLHHIRILDEVLGVLQRGSVPQRITVEMALIRLCDASFDTGNDALLARIAALEDKIALGVFPAAAESVISAESARPADEQPVPPVTDEFPEPLPEPPAFTEFPPEPLSGESTNPQTVPAAAAERKPAPAAQKQEPAAQKQAPVPSGKPVLRAFRGWQEAVRRMEAGNPELIGFLRSYKAYACDTDGKLHLIAAEPISPMLLAGDKAAMQALSEAVSIVSKDKKYREQDLLIETGDKVKTDGYELIDELIEETAGETGTENV